MADPVDYFLQGVGLGQRSRSMAIQQTNLAERATQTNRELDIREKQTNANLSRLNLLNKQLDYNMTQQSKDDSENTLQLEALKNYKTQLTEAANDPNYGDKLPLPPASLYGQHQADAIKAHDSYLASRQSDRDYKRYVADVEDKNDLIDNFGLPSSYLNAEPMAQEMMIRSSQENRANSAAARIAGSLGIDPLQAQAKGINPAAYINPSNGRLDEEMFRAAIKPMSPYVLTGIQRGPTGATSETYTTKDTIRRKRSFTNAKSASDHFTRISAEMRKMKASLMSYSGEGLTAEEADEKVSEMYKPDGYIRNTNGSLTPLYVGQQRTEEGEVYVYIGGPVASESSWKKL